MKHRSWPRLLLATALITSASAPSLRAQSLPPLAICEGQLIGERRGSSVAAAGDLNADGRGDYWVGSPFDSTSGLQRGAVRAISGLDGSVLYTILGAAAVDHFGWSLAALGDIDGDGVRDLAIGAPDNDFHALNAGAVQIASGASGSPVFMVASFVAGAALGHSLSSAGDVNGDGFDDFIAGAPFDSTAASLAGCADTYSGRNGSLLARHLGAQAADRLGFAVACAGDVDLDGRPDQVAGADQADVGAGYACVYSGRTAATLFSMTGLDKNDRFGCALAGGLDLDGDSLPDIAVGSTGARWNNLPTGAVSVFSGAGGAPRGTVYGAGSGEAFGTALALIVDLDGDGVAEVAASGAFEAGAPGAAGVVRVISSRTHRPIRVYRGRSGGDRFGSSLGSTGDWDGEGLADLIAGAPRDDAPFVDCGAAFVLSTRQVEARSYCSAKQNSQGCWPRMLALGYASVSPGATLELELSLVLNDKPGLYLFGAGRAATPFLGGTLCIAPPIQRSSAGNSGGTSGGINCTGELRHSITSSFVAGMGWSAGQIVDAQVWYRDPQHPDGTASGLSDGLEFSIWL